jgi:hypothetical protein
VFQERCTKIAYIGFSIPLNYNFTVPAFFQSTLKPYYLNFLSNHVSKSVFPWIQEKLTNLKRKLGGHKFDKQTKRRFSLKKKEMYFFIMANCYKYVSSRISDHVD